VVLVDFVVGMMHIDLRDEREVKVNIVDGMMLPLVVRDHDSGVDLVGDVLLSRGLLHVLEIHTHNSTFAVVHRSQLVRIFDRGSSALTTREPETW
jgi:hypothetical protein